MDGLVLVRVSVLSSLISSICWKSRPARCDRAIVAIIVSHLDTRETTSNPSKVTINGRCVRQG